MSTAAKYLTVLAAARLVNRPAKSTGMFRATLLSFSDRRDSSKEIHCMICAAMETDCVTSGGARGARRGGGSNLNVVGVEEEEEPPPLLPLAAVESVLCCAARCAVRDAASACSCVASLCTPSTCNMSNTDGQSRKISKKTVIYHTRFDFCVMSYCPWSANLARNSRVLPAIRSNMVLLQTRRPTMMNTQFSICSFNSDSYHFLQAIAQYITST